MLMPSQVFSEVKSLEVLAGVCPIPSVSATRSPSRRPVWFLAQSAPRFPRPSALTPPGLFPRPSAIMSPRRCATACPSRSATASPRRSATACQRSSATMSPSRHAPPSQGRCARLFPTRLPDKFATRPKPLPTPPPLFWLEFNVRSLFSPLLVESLPAEPLLVEPLLADTLLEALLLEVPSVVVLLLEVPSMVLPSVVFIAGKW